VLLAGILCASWNGEETSGQVSGPAKSELTVGGTMAALVPAAIASEGTKQTGLSLPTKTTPVAVVELVFAYGSEKQGWIEEVTRTFNGTEHRLNGGQGVHVTTKAAGSGEIVDELLSGRLEAHLVSPAATAFVILGNGKSRESSQGDLLGPTKELVRSPVVLATWPDLADALGWRQKPPSWREIFNAARNSQKWAEMSAKLPRPSPFRLGHTRPDNSNSGLHALFLMAYAATNHFDGNVSRAELLQPTLSDFLREVETSVVHPLESSTGFLATSMVSGGPAKMTAAIIYENLVIEANRREVQSGRPESLVAIFPTEGTFPTEHPVGIVRRPWVGPLHQEAAEVYMKYLLDKPQQDKARAHGFRPAGDRSLRVADLPAPSASTIATLRKVWQDQFATPSAKSAAASL
jgi:Ca-activated chloride channel family protein